MSGLTGRQCSKALLFVFERSPLLSEATGYLEILQIAARLPVLPRCSRLDVKSIDMDPAGQYNPY